MTINPCVFLNALKARSALKIAALERLLEILNEYLLVDHAIMEQVSIRNNLDLLRGVKLLVARILLEELNE